MLQSYNCMKKLTFVFVVILSIGSIAFAGSQILKLNQSFKEVTGLATPKTKPEPNTSNSKYKTAKIFNILLLGIDRRSKAETGYRSDIMILVSINQDQKKIVLTSVPRDLWVSGGRINATFVGGGWPAMQEA